MSKVIVDISMSLDGYVTAPGVDLEHGLGIGGEAIHAWVLEEPRSPSTKRCWRTAMSGPAQW